MTKDERELLDTLVQQRISFYYDCMKKCSEEEANQREQLDDAFEAILDKLPKEDADIIRAHEDMIISIGGQEEQEVYLGGVRDGMRLQEGLKKFLEQP